MLIQVLDLVGVISREQSGKKRGRKTEREEDEELLQEVAEDEQAPIARHLTCSPQWVRGGTMRDYQIEGLNWLIKLYDTGLNGILADEMVTPSLSDIMALFT